MPDTDLNVLHLRCEYLSNPEGIGITRPRLSWRIASEKAGTRQTEYRLQVASKVDQLREPDLWDSGWVSSSQTTHIHYDGKELTSRSRAWWQITAQDNQGNTAQSEPAYWSVGLLQTSDWVASWITAHPDVYTRDAEANAGDSIQCATPVQFRREFKVEKPIERAVLYASAQGLFAFQLNGHRASEDIFAPEWTDYRCRIQYRAYDVTDLIKEGPNALAAYLGDGWYSGYVGWQESRGRYGLQNSLIGQLEVIHTDGSRETVSTDSTWRCNTGPILKSDFMMGETHDARRERQGWDCADFVDTDWLPSIPAKAPDARLVWQASEPVRIVEELTPVRIDHRQDGSYIFDIGQNIAGRVRLKISGSAGTRITIRHAERLTPEGDLYTENLRRAEATDTYILKGTGVEIWEPLFTFHGFQYVEIRGMESPPNYSTITACVIQSGTPQCGEFSCAHAGVNRLWKNALWSQKDNFLSVPTDCPQRDERLGWMGDAQVFLRTAMYNMDVAAFFTKWMQDICDAQTDDGIFPDTAPRLPENEGNFVGLDGLGGGPAWANAGVIIPWTLWRIYGDTEMVQQTWDNMGAWMQHLEKHNPDWLWVNEMGNNYGDWLCIPTDTSFRTQSPMKDLLATAFWANDASKMVDMAEALGKEAYAQHYRIVFANIQSAFQKDFLKENGILSVETQTAYLLALAFDLLPPEHRQSATARLVQLIEENDCHLSTGFVGIRFLNTVLSDYGYHDLAYKLLLHEDYPSWLYPVKHGATTIWERWNGWTHEDGFFNPHMNSFNHYSLGSVAEWMYSHVAGIQPHPDHPGFQHFILKPYPSLRLGQARAIHTSIHGDIESAWNISSDGLHWEFSIPTNTTADVFIPLGEDETVTLNGETVTDYTVLRKTYPSRARIELPSGRYSVSTAYLGT
jgi:alpha-L-rhamnosidase